MFSDLVRRNRENNPNLFKKEEPINIVRLQHEGNNYTSGLAVLIKNFENSRYFWYVLSDWSRVWHPSETPFDVIIFKEFEDGTILTEFCGIPEGVEWIGPTKILHTDPGDKKFTLRIYQCYPNWNQETDRPAAYIAAGHIVPGSVVKLISSQMTTGATNKQFFFDTIDNYRKFHGVGPESVLENFWYTVWDTSCAITPDPIKPPDTKATANEEKLYRQLFELRHRDEIKEQLRKKTNRPAGVRECDIKAEVDRYWNVLTGTERKKDEYFRFLRNEQTSYRQFYNEFIPKPVVAKLDSSGKKIVVQ